MYEILYFRGGVYKFDELIEFVEDVGGMVLKKDYFEIIRVIILYQRSPCTACSAKRGG